MNGRTGLALGLFLLLGALASGAELSADQRKRVIEEARAAGWKGVPYKLGGNYEPGQDKKKGLDCSHFVHGAYKRVVLGLPYLSTSAIPTSGRFAKVDAAEIGDLILFPAQTIQVKGKDVKAAGHVGIVVDPAKSVFIGQQTSTGVAEAGYGPKAYWGQRRYEFYRLK